MLRLELPVSSAPKPFFGTPHGRFRNAQIAEGTKKIAISIARPPGCSLVGGGDSGSHQLVGLAQKVITFPQVVVPCSNTWKMAISRE